MTALPEATGVCAPSADEAQSPLTFVEVFAEFGGYVPALLARLGVASRDVPDLAQEVFTVVHEKLASFRGDSRLKTWLCGITLRVASNHRRKAWVKRVVLSDDMDCRSAPEPYAQLEVRERIVLLQRILAQLPAAQRDVFVLFEVEELAMAEVARLLGCREKTAYTRLYAARRFIADQLRASEQGARSGS